MNLPEKVINPRKKKVCKPWEIYKAMKQDFTISLPEFRNRLTKALEESKTSTNDYKKVLTYCALASVLYICGSRITEILRPRPIKTFKRILKDGIEKTYNYEYAPGEGLKLKDVSLYPEEKIEDKPQYLVFRIKVRKTREEVVFRNAYIRYDDLADPYRFLIDIFLEYKDILILGDNIDEDNLLFNISVESARKNIMKYFGIPLHLIRDMRASHLLSINKLSIPELQKFFAWKDPKMPMVYARANMDDLLEKL